MFGKNKAPVISVEDQNKATLGRINTAYPAAPANITGYLKNNDHTQWIIDLVTGLKAKIEADAGKQKWPQYKTDINTFLHKLALQSTPENYCTFMTLIDPKNELKGFKDFLLGT